MPIGCTIVTYQLAHWHIATLAHYYMIKLEGITKSFGSLQVLKGIDLEINKGEVVSIVGPSGAGKTTLLQIMGTLDEPDAGHVYIDGTNVSRMKEKELSAFRNKHIGFVFQFHQLLPEFTALENIMIPALIAGASSKEVTAHALEILNFMGAQPKREWGAHPAGQAPCGSRDPRGRRDGGPSHVTPACRFAPPDSRW